ncbi:5'-adenylylsulfate reductase-like 3 [Physcomitrium patens]|uniref:Thioredoxin domain-containing protein n=1 Tax=Physcomitrium patens TaxID=3218 RepID=A0A2K1KWW2_PHYPA|nr:5'-adenylylsulfate reductase-like 3 [Physcomitrium patens]XP_024372250.1 5'-adenylylsulfate reductase-like 3 [Physcomitrium patens]XP_024372251.1 5'-adenylylsulfate reductase-like 3 [Physcomitrium patens]PNR58240.1 hypothetical protein PHYPA_005235 [Physcomitrium patens]|eukprot:XP_024372249.1 5'-adenylylsulfate reductase-like 3 [Physcomitrella patens]
MMYFRCVIQYLPQKPTNICGLLCAILIVSLSSTRADSGTTHSISLSNYHCPAPTLQETLAPPLGFCSFDTQAFSFKHNHAASDQPLSARVAELNETTLEKALDLVHSSNGTYMAVLHYATWCPFSRQVRPVYDVLSTIFPTVHHVAIEESSVRPSVLSQYGVHSFPVLFMHNRTARVRYYGPRQLESLILFYQNYTGLKANEGQPGRKEDCAFARLVYDAGTEMKEGCPYPWAISPEKWLQDDMYLNLAVVFLVLRLVYVLIPAVLIRLKEHWENRDYTQAPLSSNYPNTSNEGGSLLGNASQVSDDADTEKQRAGSANGLNDISVSSWSSAQAVTQSSSASSAESSSSRAGSPGEVYDIGEKEMY